MTIKSNYCQAPRCNKPRDKSQGSAYCSMHRMRRSRHKSLDLPEKEKLPENIIKICKVHGELTLKHAYKVPQGNWYNCKICKSERSKRFHKENPNYKPTRNYYFFGKGIPRLKITVVEYEKIYNEQNGLCKICKKPEIFKVNNTKHKEIKRLAIDHCHKTKKVRGLLCQNCNVGLGNLGDSIELLEAAILYLKESNND